jgi:hypothetical protein
MKPRLVLAALFWLCAAGPGLPAEMQPFSFTVPVGLSQLHKNLTLLRVRCWVFAGADWKAGDAALGEGVSGPADTHLAQGLRSYKGDIPVNVPLRDPRRGPGAAKSYRCQVELYDAAGRVWGDTDQIDKRYPLDKKTRAVTETGGLLGN